MRVSKVKVEDKMVLMHRTNKEGALIIGNSTDNKTKEILPEKKMENFYKSIINKTLVKERKYYTTSKKEVIVKRNKNIENTLINLIEGNDIDKINEIETERIKKNLTLKFKDTFKYKPKDKELIEFNLADLIHNYSKKNDKIELEKYKTWVDWYIKTKCDFLIKSIENNIIVLNNGEEKLSLRKKVLISYEEEFKKNGKIDISTLAEKEFKIEDLTNRFKPIVDKYIEEREKDKNNNTLEHKLNLSLKEALQKHQKDIFGRKGEEKRRVYRSDEGKIDIEKEESEENKINQRLAIYNLEVVKYLEHYFPIKASKRRNSIPTIEYHIQKPIIEQTIQQQIENAIRLNMIQRGKIVHHELDKNPVDSNILTTIKRQEAFVLNMIGACAFASNNIRNIVDSEQGEDILVRKAFTESLNKGRVDSNLLKLFLGKDSISNEETLWAMRGSIRGIRNNVIHYNKEAIGNIFEIKAFENPIKENDQNETSYNSSIFKDYLQEDINKLPKLFANQLMTGGVLSYYSIDNLKAILDKIEFNLCRSSIPFTPSFKKVFKGGCDYKKDKPSLNLNNYITKEKNNETEEEYQARYFLLKLLYNNIFIPSFEGDNFREAAKYVLEENKNNAFLKGKRYEYAFKEIKKINDRESIQEYMSYLQSSIIQEKIAKDEKKLKNNTEERYNFEKYLLDIYIKGFDNFISKLDIDRINKTEYQFDLALTNDLKAKELIAKKKEITQDCKVKKGVINAEKPINDVEKSTHVAFYTFCKLLDANYLSNLRNEIIKYRQSLIDDKQDEKKDNEIDKEKTFTFQYLLEIIELCLLKADNIGIDESDIENENDKKESNKEKKDLITYNDEIKYFFEKDFNLGDFDKLYLQSDKRTVIEHSNIELLNKYGTKQRLIDLVSRNSKFEITKKEWEEWERFNIQIKDSKITEIESKINEKNKIHEEWKDKQEEWKDKLEEWEKEQKEWRKKQKECREIDRKDKEKRIKDKPKKEEYELNEEQKERYENLANEIDRYNWLDNKLHFVHLKKVHSLNIEILGRMAGFIALFDRDFIMLDARRTSDKFKLVGFVSFFDLLENNKKKIEKYTSLYDCPDIKDGKIKRQDDTDIQESDKADLILCLQEKRLYYQKVFFDKGTNIFNIRNYIAHFNYLTKESVDYSLIDLINQLRGLLSYDRKLKNAVTKSIIDIFDKNGMELTLELDNESKHILRLKDIKPKKIYHLGIKKGKDEIATNQVPVEFCEICKSLLEL